MLIGCGNLAATCAARGIDERQLGKQAEPKYQHPPAGTFVSVGVLIVI
jgi:hypothetical protein